MSVVWRKFKNKMQQLHCIDCYRCCCLYFSAAYETQTVTCLVAVQLANCSRRSDHRQWNCSRHCTCVLDT